MLGQQNAESVPLTYGASGTKSSIFPPATKRKRINLLAIVLNLFAPWFLFCAVFAMTSFSFHYQHPTWTWIFVGLAASFSLVLAVIAVRQRRRDNDPMWYTFAAVACLIAVVAGCIFGDMNFWFNMQPFYNINNLNVYPDVNVLSTEGQQLMDAGRVYFSEGSTIDKSKAMGFKNLDNYCVAPIVVGDQPPPAKYEFFAVGVNCCSGTSGSFQCGEFDNPKARAGLRLMKDDQRPFFRLAVKQAEAAYQITSPHPLFFYWVQDPVAEMNALADDGFKYYLLGMFVHFGVNVFCVVGAVIGVSRFSSGNY